MSPQHAIFIVIAVVVLTVGGYVFWKRPRDLVHQTFFLFVFGVAAWIVSFVLFSLTEEFYVAKLILVSGLVFVIALYLLAHIFPDKKTIPNRAFLSLIPLLLLALVTLGSRLVLQGATVIEGKHLEPLNGPWFPLFAIIVTCYMVVSIGIFIRNYRGSKGRTRLQMKYLFLGLGIFITLAVFFDAILPAFGITQLNTLGPLASLAFVGFTAYAIVRHQLLDIKIVVQRGLIYTILLVLIIGFYLILVSLLGYFVQQTTNITILVAAGITVVFGIFGTPIIDRYLRKVTDRIFFKDTYNYSEALYTLSEILNRNIDLEVIIRESSEALQYILRASYVHIVFDEDREHPEEKDGGLEVPILNLEERRGCIHIGPKLSGDPFTTQDLSLVRTFSQQAGVALEKARLFKEVEDYSLELENKVAKRTAEIQQLLRDQEQMVVEISHGLQDPLTVSKIEIEDMRKKLGKNEKWFDVLEHSIDSVSAFIYRLLHLARLERDTKEPGYDLIDLSALLEEHVEYFVTLAKQQNVEVVSYIEPDIILRSSKKDLEEIITNLVSNAIKYNVRDIPHKKIYIGLVERDEKITLTVEDTGVGIGREDVPYVFNKFHRAAHNRRAGVKSTGLGLSIVKRIVDLYEGSISILSTPGRGTVITVTLPQKP